MNSDLLETDTWEINTLELIESGFYLTSSSGNFHTNCQHFQILQFNTLTIAINSIKIDFVAPLLISLSTANDR